MSFSERFIKMDFDSFLSDVLKLSETEPIYCPDYQTDSCKGGCNLKHIKLANAVVCKHWLRGMCKKNEKCTFLHDFDLKKMPECFFFNVYGVCNNIECFYRHVNRNIEANECVNYKKGFCKDGPDCKNRHVRRELCYYYASGFCIKGPDCKLTHLRIK